MIPHLPIAPALMAAHEDKFHALLDRYERLQKIHPTLLITGLDGVGKRSMVIQLIQKLFCDQPGANLEPCGVCKSCKRAQQNQWLDLMWLEPDTGDDDSRLGIHKIDAFRELKTKLGMGPAEEPFRIVVITNADRMTPQAANSILKTLEEPPPNWIFILTATDASRLLPTILSRCMEIKLKPLSPQTIMNVLQQIQGAELQQARARIASRAAEGSISRALHFMDDETWKIRDQILGLLSNPASEWMKLIDSFSSSQRTLQLSLDLIESLMMDLVKQHVEENHIWANEDQKEFLLQWQEAKRIPTGKILTLLTRIAEKRQFTTLTLNSKLLAQETLIPLLETLVS
jgi:DNA polymerase-3 subunit delta'